MAEPYLPPEMAAPVPPPRPRTSSKLAPNPFANDDGAQPPAFAEAKLVDPPYRTPAVVGAMATDRVLVPMVAHAHPGRTADGGVREHASFGSGDATADACESAAALTVEVADGRAAMPVFSSYPAMRAWNPDARPVPVYGYSAARAAVSVGEGLMILDPGDEPVLIPRPAVWALAQEQPWTPAWEDPEVSQAVVDALVGIEEVVAARVELGTTTEIRVVAALRHGLTAPQLKDTLTRASAAIGGNDVLKARVDTIELYPTSLPSDG